MTELGTLHPLGDETYQLVFVRTMRHPIEKVWRAITEAEHLAHWFPDGMQPDFASGGRLRFVPAGNDDLAFEGEVLAFQPPTLVEFTWGTDTIRIELAPAADGHDTVLTFTDTFGELGKAARDGAGWHDCLDELGHHLAGTAADRSQGTRWREVHQAYIQALGPEASAVGIPDGYELPD